MKRSLTLTVMAIAGAAILATALIGFHLLQGGVDYSAYAHVVDLNNDTTIDSGDVHLELDLNPMNGSGPCDPVDNNVNTFPGHFFEVAVCLTSSGARPASFHFDLTYNDTVNTCVPVTPCTEPALDCNPDANAGNTTFSVPSLGQGWDCSPMGADPPKCDTDSATGAGHGRAHISCRTTGAPTLPIGNTSAPIAEVLFRSSVTGGQDTLSLDAVNIFDASGNNILSCPGGPGTCFGGTDQQGSSGGPGVGGVVKLPPAAVTADSDASSENSGWPAGAYGALAACVVAAAVGVGRWCATRRRVR